MTTAFRPFINKWEIQTEYTNNTNENINKWGRCINISPKDLEEKYDFDYTALNNYWNINEKEYNEKFLDMYHFGYTKPGENSQVYEEGNFFRKGGVLNKCYWAIIIEEFEYYYMGTFDYFETREEIVKRGEVLGDEKIDLLIECWEEKMFHWESDFNNKYNEGWDKDETSDEDED